jgi:tetraacyldisaccharide 4'-kinase
MNAASYLALIRGERRGLAATLLRLGLSLVSVPYGGAVRLRNLAYGHGWKRTNSAAVPVVSVGNLTLGGTGKTPCVEYLAHWFREREVRVAILSRGYGAEAGRNDEALVLEENCPDVPHLQGPDRVALARIAVEELETELLILDDAFQHRRLARDLDIVLVDATCPWGHGHLFPRGLLREPASSLRRAGLVVMTRCDLASADCLQSLRREIERRARGTAIVESAHRPAAWSNGPDERALDFVHGRPLAAFCGLGNPDAFRRTLEELAGSPIAWRTFPDHHAYTRDDIEDLRAWARSLPEDVIVATTQKDLVKIRLQRLSERELWALKIRLDIRSGEAELTAKLEDLLKRRQVTH